MLLHTPEVPSVRGGLPLSVDGPSQCLTSSFVYIRCVTVASSGLTGPHSVASSGFAELEGEMRLLHTARLCPLAAAA
jgi:hypothetical protein